MNKEKVEQALDNYINNSLELRRSSLEFLKSIALECWNVIRSIHDDKNADTLYFRFYYNGDKWILDCLDPECFVQKVENIYWVWNYNSDLMNMISVIANHSGLCKENSKVENLKDYGQIKIDFKD